MTVGQTPTPSDKLSLPAEAASVAAARRFVRGIQWSGTETHHERLALLVSELATNAVLHARTAFSVSAHATDKRVRISVEDKSPVLPVRKNYSPTSPTGRGISLVDTLSSRWGVEPNDSGKIVWFELDAGVP